MTITQRRNRVDPTKPEERVGIEPGIKVTCDFCHLDITHSTVRFKCADEACRDVDLCPSCFCEGKEGQRHKAWHDYRVEEYLSTPIFSPDWGADEELLLISGLITFGLGNWLEVAGYIGTRTKEECEKHYYEVFLGVGLDGRELPRKGEERKSEVKVERSGDVEMEGGEEGQKRKREFMPPMNAEFSVDADEWQARKKARIEEMRKPQTLPPPTGPLVSAPTNHEVAGFMPGRLEFEHEVENEAEMAVKDLEFGLVWRYGGDEQPESVPVPVPDEDPAEEEEEADGADGDGAKGEKKGGTEKEAKGDGVEKVVVKVEKGSGEVKEEAIDVDAEADVKPDISRMADVAPAAGEGVGVNGLGRGEEGPNGNGKGVSPTKVDKGKEKAKEEPLFEVEDEDELDVKLALLEIYFSKLDKREEAKEIIFDRGLTEHKRIQAAERRRPREERDLIHRYKVFAKLQTAEDFEVLTEGLIVEQNLRKRIAELQEYRRMGITTAAEAEVYDQAKITRAGYKPIGLAPRERVEAIISGARTNAGQNRFLHGTPPPHDKSGRDTPKGAPRRPVAPLNLANSQSLDLLTEGEQALCSSLRILPKPYLAMKELYLRENERRHGHLKRREARKMLKIDVNKSGRIFDYLVSSGIMRLAYDPSVKGIGPGKEGHVIHANGTGHPPYGSVSGISNGNGGAGAANGGGGGGGGGEVPYPRQGLAEVYPPNGAVNGSGGR